MTTPYIHGPRCIRCTHPAIETVGMIAVHNGRPATFICFDCVDVLKLISDQERKRADEMTYTVTAHGVGYDEVPSDLELRALNSDRRTARDILIEERAALGARPDTWHIANALDRAIAALAANSP